MPRSAFRSAIAMPPFQYLGNNDSRSHLNLVDVGMSEIVWPNCAFACNIRQDCAFIIARQLFRLFLSDKS